jgi:general secretion pathway protein D
MNLRTSRSPRSALAVAALFLLGAASTFAQGPISGSRTGGTTTGGGFSGSGGSSSTGGRNYQNTTMVGDAMISSDVDTRRLIVVTDDATNDNIKQIIANLDKPKPQVLINVVFMQVTHDNSFDLGAEATYKGHVAIKTNPTGTATTDFGVKDAYTNSQILNSPIYGAFYQLVGRDISATIHALSGVAKTEVLSRPSILTRSNQQATILVGQTIPLLSSSTTNTNSNAITTTVAYQDVGIILKVTPFITSNGFVEMIVSPEISSLSVTTINSQPVIDKRSADTVVVTPSDSTIVIGGLMSSQKNDSVSKVPLLGDIPLIGNAFKHTNTDHIKTELLIFLTPHVVNTPEELATVSTGERARLDMSPKTFEQADLSKFIGQPPAKN